MNAIELLVHDHETVKKLLNELSETTERALKKRSELLGRLELELVLSLGLPPSSRTIRSSSSAAAAQSRLCSSIAAFNCGSRRSSAQAWKPASPSLLVCSRSLSTSRVSSRLVWFISLSLARSCPGFLASVSAGACRHGTWAATSTHGRWEARRRGAFRKPDGWWRRPG